MQHLYFLLYFHYMIRLHAAIFSWRWLHGAETCSGRRARNINVAYQWTHLILINGFQCKYICPWYENSSVMGQTQSVFSCIFFNWSLKYGQFLKRSDVKLRPWIIVLNKSYRICVLLFTKWFPVVCSGMFPAICYR
jgi:hypothetical protein